MNLGVMFEDKEINEFLQCVSIVHVDDNDLILDGEEAKNKMQLLLKTYNKLYGVIGGFIED